MLHIDYNHSALRISQSRTASDAPRVPSSTLKWLSGLCLHSCLNHFTLACSSRASVSSHHWHKATTFQASRAIEQRAIVIDRLPKHSKHAERQNTPLLSTDQYSRPHQIFTFCARHHKLQLARPLSLRRGLSRLRQRTFKQALIHRGHSEVLLSKQRKVFVLVINL